MLSDTCAPVRVGTILDFMVDRINLIVNLIGTTLNNYIKTSDAVLVNSVFSCEFLVYLQHGLAGNEIIITQCRLLEFSNVTIFNQSMTYWSLIVSVLNSSNVTMDQIFSRC